MQQPQVVKVRIKYAVTLMQFITRKLALQLTMSFSFCLIFAIFFIVFLQKRLRLKLQFE